MDPVNRMAHMTWIEFTIAVTFIGVMLWLLWSDAITLFHQEERQLLEELPADDELAESA